MELSYHLPTKLYFWCERLDIAKSGLDAILNLMAVSNGRQADPDGVIQSLANEIALLT
jgi:hypothetical protein